MSGVSFYKVLFTFVIKMSSYSNPRGVASISTAWYAGAEGPGPRCWPNVKKIKKYQANMKMILGQKPRPAFL